MWKAVTFISAVTTMAVLALLIFLLEKVDNGLEWAVMATWFRLCDWLLPNSRADSGHPFERATTPPLRAGGLRVVRKQEAGARTALATHR